jgi:hypothetical protein
MIVQHVDESRAAYLMRVAAEYINNWPEERIDYDDAQCDGYCLAEELAQMADNMPCKE